MEIIEKICGEAHHQLARQEGVVEIETVVTMADGNKFTATTKTLFVTKEPVDEEPLA